MIRAAFLVYKLDTYGGAAAQALALARTVSTHSVEVTIFNVSGAERLREERVDGVRIVHLPRSPLRRALALLELLRGFDVVHLHGFFLVPIALAHARSMPVVLKTTLLGDDDFASLRRQRLGALRVALARRIGFNNALTRQLAAINAPFLPPERIGVIHNGVRVPLGAPATKERLFVFVGALVPRKRPHLAIAYFLRHYATLPGARLMLVGPHDASVPEHDADYVASLRQMADAAPAGTVTIEGRVDRAGVEARLERALALLFFSAAEGLPNVVLEAMAHDCVPVVTPMQGVAGEFVDAGVTGFIVDEPPALAASGAAVAAMRAVPIDALERIAASGAGRAAMGARFSLAAVGARHADVYRRLAGGAVAR